MDNEDGIELKGLTSPHCGMGWIPRPGVTCGLSFDWFFSLILGVFSGFSTFLPSQKPILQISVQFGIRGQEETPRIVHYLIPLLLFIIITLEP